MNRASKLTLLLTICLTANSNSVRAQFGINYGDGLEDTEQRLVTDCKTPKERLLKSSQLLKKHPNNPTALAMHAEMLEEMQKYKEALSEISKALKLRPDRSEWILGRARIYFEMNELHKALLDCDEAYKTSGITEWKTWSLKSKILMAMGKKDEAIKSAQESLFNLASLGFDKSYDPESVKLARDFIPKPRKRESGELLDMCSDIAKLPSPPDVQTYTRLLAEKLSKNSDTSNVFRDRVMNIRCGDSTDQVRLYPEINAVTIEQEDVNKRFPHKAPELQGLRSAGPEKEIRVLEGNCLITFLFHFRGFEPLTTVIFQWKKGADPS